MITRGLNALGGLIARGLNALGFPPVVRAHPHPERTLDVELDFRELEPDDDFRWLDADDHRDLDVPAAANPEYALFFVVEAEDRSWEVNPEARELAVEAQPDVIDVHAEAQAVTVEDEGRTMEPQRAPEIEA